MVEVWDMAVNVEAIASEYDVQPSEIGWCPSCGALTLCGICQDPRCGFSVSCCVCGATKQPSGAWAQIPHEVLRESHGYCHQCYMSERRKLCA